MSKPGPFRCCTNFTIQLPLYLICGRLLIIIEIPDASNAYSQGYCSSCRRGLNRNHTHSIGARTLNNSSNNAVAAGRPAGIRIRTFFSYLFAICVRFLKLVSCMLGGSDPGRREYDSPKQQLIYSFHPPTQPCRRRILRTTRL